MREGAAITSDSGKVLSLPKPLFLHLQNGNNDPSHPMIAAHAHMAHSPCKGLDLGLSESPQAGPVGGAQGV